MVSLTLLSLALGNIASIVSAVAVTPTSIEGVQPSIIRRDESIKTITLGDIGQYSNYDGDDTVEKRSVAIFPTGIVTSLPESGMHVVFGPDMQNDMDKVIRDKCKTQDQISECQQEINKLLQDSSLSTHSKRFLPIIAAATVAEIVNTLVAAIVAALGGLAIGAGINAATAPDSVNFEDTSQDGVLAQIKSLSDASTIAIATGTANEIMGTFTVSTTISTATPEPDKAVRVEEVTQDNGDDKKGDILIYVPETTANRMLDYLGMMGLEQVKSTCNPGFQREQMRQRLNRRVPPTLSEECEEMLAQLAGSTLEATNNELAQMFPANADNPMNPANDPEGAAVPDINVNGALLVVRLVRQFFGNNNPERGRFDEFLMRAAIISELILGIVQGIEQNRQAINGAAAAFLTVRMAKEMIKKVSSKQAECSRNLICLKDDCKGTMELKPLLGFLGESQTFQTGRCTTKEHSGCFCAEVLEPYVHREADGYFESLEAWIQALLAPAPEANCDSNNKITVDPEDFEGSKGSACHNKDELRRLKKRGLHGWEWSNVDRNGLQWSFDWNDKGDQCDMSCEDVFETFKMDDNCAKGGVMSKTGLVETDCGIASYSVDKPNPPECWPADFGAPRGQKEVDEEGGGGTSVEAALESFCNDIDGQKVEDNTDEEKTTHAKRWGYAEWRVSNRRSFWLKAQYASRPGCQGYEFPHKTNCKAALRQGLDACSANQGRTTGFSIQGIGCIDYSIHISDSTRDDSPPWKETVKEFPPPLSAQKIGGGAHEVNCTWYTTPGKPLQDQDFNNALDAFCKDGADIKGWGRDHWDDMTDYPPEGQPQFWAGKQLGMHLTMGAKTVNNDGNDEPYEDISWCHGYDWKLGRDDCMYALRRIYGTCSKDGELYGGDFTYRCVHYNSWPIWGSV